MTTQQKIIEINKQPKSFTPGEWYAHGEGFPKPDLVTLDGETWENSDCLICADRNGEKTLVAIVKFSTLRSGFATVDDLEEAKANARLVLHATELFGALSGLIDPNKKGVNTSHDAIAKAQAVLAKIKGE